MFYALRRREVKESGGRKVSQDVILARGKFQPHSVESSGATGTALHWSQTL